MSSFTPTKSSFQAPYTTTLSQKSPETNKTRHALKNISKYHQQPQPPNHQLSFSPPVFSEHDRSDEVIFPDEDVPLIPKLNAAPKCAKKSSTYCEILDTYPHRHVQEVLRNGVQEYTLFFGEDESEPEMVHRIGDVERFVCPSVAKVIFPQGAKNTKNEWRFIVNQMDESYVQGIRVEECARWTRWRIKQKGDNNVLVL